VLVQYDFSSGCPTAAGLQWENRFKKLAWQLAYSIKGRATRACTKRGSSRFALNNPTAPNEGRGGFLVPSAEAAIANAHETIKKIIFIELAILWMTNLNLRFPYIFLFPLLVGNVE
jgi:hypothetical protein